MNALIAEDDALTRRMLEASLTKWGYNCQSARNGLEAWDYYQKGEYDLLITDWLMPGMNGVELCRKIRGHLESNYTYIILLTSLDSRDHITEGFEVGVDDYIGKPFEPFELKARMKAGERILNLERNLAGSNKRMESDLKKAAKTLESLLPIQKEGFNKVKFDWYFKPTAFIGGDIFNVLRLDDKRVAIYMVDVSGHGVSAALLATTLSHLLRPLIEHGGILKEYDSEGNRVIRPPREIAGELNKRFPIDEETNMYFTFFYGIIDMEKMELHWVRAGHPMPLRISEKGVTILRAGNPPIGFIENYKFSDEITRLTAGDRIILYSDGVIEPDNSKGEQFGETRLTSIIEKNQEEPLAVLIRQTMTDLSIHHGDNNFDDDISILVVELDKDIT